MYNTLLLPSFPGLGGDMQTPPTRDSWAAGQLGGGRLSPQDIYTPTKMEPYTMPGLGGDTPGMDLNSMPGLGDLPKKDNYSMPGLGDLPKKDNYSMPGLGDLPKKDVYSMPGLGDLPKKDNYSISEFLTKMAQGEQVESRWQPCNACCMVQRRVGRNRTWVRPKFQVSSGFARFLSCTPLV